MNAAAPAFLIAIEQSALAAGVREATWIYPAANIGHVVALAVFAGAVAVMDVRLLGGMRATAPADVVLPAQRVAVLAFLAMLATGTPLFMAEASHVALNPVFQVKGALIALALLNAARLQSGLRADLAATPAGHALPARYRTGAVLSIAIWLCVAAAGRTIAYL